MVAMAALVGGLCQVNKFASGSRHVVSRMGGQLHFCVFLFRRLLKCFFIHVIVFSMGKMHINMLTDVYVHYFQLVFKTLHAV